jgi:hypothetical protein
MYVGVTIPLSPRSLPEGPPGGGQEALIREFVLLPTSATGKRESTHFVFGSAGRRRGFVLPSAEQVLRTMPTLALALAVRWGVL